jgi:ribonuclease HI
MRSDDIYPQEYSYERLVHLEYPCISNQAEYEALLFGLQGLVDMGVRDIDAFGDSLLVVQQIILISNFIVLMGC